MLLFLSMKLFLGPQIGGSISRTVATRYAKSLQAAPLKVAVYASSNRTTLLFLLLLLLFPLLLLLLARSDW